MTEEERMVWAAVYATRWAQAREKQEVMGLPVSTPTCIEEACAAVSELHDAAPDVAEGWGEDSVEYGMLKRILGHD